MASVARAAAAAGRGVTALLRTSTTRTGARHICTSGTAHNIITSKFPDVELPSGNLVSCVFKNSSKWANSVATECVVTGRRYTYCQLIDSIARWGGMLTKLGLTKGDTIAVMMLNCPEYPIVMLGAVSIGVGVSLINSSYTPDEVHRQLRDSDPKLVVGDTHTQNTIEAALVLHNKPTVLVVNGPSSVSGAIDLRQMLEDTSVPFADPIEVSGSEMAMMLYSSGTTGNPKGVVLSHGSVSSNLAMFTDLHFFAGRETTGSYQDVYFCYLPFFHGYGIVAKLMAGLHVGAKLVCVPRFDPNTFVKDIARHKVRLLHTVPPVLNFLTQSPSATPEALATVEVSLCSGAPLTSSAAKAFLEKIRNSIILKDGFGLSEALFTHVTARGHEQFGKCGHILPNISSKIVDTATGETLPLGELGEICIKSPSVMSGYFQNPEGTAEAIDSDGWLHSGDVGSYDEQGLLTIVDRIKELIKVKAFQVAPSELEDVILQHPKVVQVGVVGVPDERLGEAPRAYVVTSAPTTQAEIKEFVEQKVAPHKRLAGGVAFINELPKTASGKLLRRELKKMALA